MGLKTLRMTVSIHRNFGAEKCEGWVQTDRYGMIKYLKLHSQWPRFSIKCEYRVKVCDVDIDFLFVYIRTTVVARLRSPIVLPPYHLHFQRALGV